MSGETFESLLAPTLPAIRKFVRAKIGMLDDTDDVVQQTLMRAFAHREQLREHSKFKSWLMSIATNEIRGLSRRTRICVALEALPPMASFDRPSCPFKSFEDGERADRLRAGLAQLNPRDRKTIHLMDLDEVRLADAAKALSLSQAALKSTHFRARRRLRAAMHTRPRVAA